MRTSTVDPAQRDRSGKTAMTAAAISRVHRGMHFAAALVK
jgi:hypothetical protein